MSARRHVSAGVLVLLLILAACSRDPSAKPQTKTDLLVLASWKIQKVTVGGIDVTSQLDACEMDNTVTFQANGNGSWDEGATKCNAGDPQTNPFTWALQSNDTVLEVSDSLFTGGSGRFTLMTLTSSQLVLSQNITYGGTTQTAVVTFMH
ncbi:MAG TPA: lipocalin family protein [Chitinophagaceae bacterium]|nr:lipocalin family protein [Chitinophagaceae bacterium]